MRMDAPMSCPPATSWLASLQADQLSSSEREHLQECPACRARVHAIRETAPVHLELPQDAPWVQQAAPVTFKLGSYPALAPSRGEVWLSAPSLSFGGHSYQDLDKLMFVVLDTDVCDAGRRWVDVAPIWPDVELAGEADVILAPHHSTLNAPLRFQPKRQLLMALEQLERKVGQVVEDALQILLAAAAGGEVDAAWRGTPYSGPYDPRVELDRWTSEILDRLREPYAQALADAEQAIERADPAEHLAQLAELIPLKARIESISDSHRFQLAAEKGGRSQALHVYDEQSRVDVLVSVDVLRSVVHVLVRNLLADWVQAVELLLEVRDGHMIAVPDLRVGEHDVHDPYATALKEIAGAYIRTTRAPDAR